MERVRKEISEEDIMYYLSEQTPEITFENDLLKLEKYEKTMNFVLNSNFKKFPIKIGQLVNSENFNWLPFHYSHDTNNRSKELNFWFVMKINLLIKLLIHFHKSGEMDCFYFIDQLLICNYSKMEDVERCSPSAITIITESCTKPTEFTNFGIFNDLEYLKRKVTLKFKLPKQFMIEFFNNNNNSKRNVKKFRKKDKVFITKLLRELIKPVVSITSILKKLELTPNLFQTSIIVIKFLRKSLRDYDNSSNNDDNNNNKKMQSFRKINWIMKFFIFLLGNDFPTDKELFSNQETSYLEHFPSLKTFEDEIYTLKIKKLIDITLINNPLLYKRSGDIGGITEEDKRFLNFLKIGLPFQIRDHKIFVNFKKNYKTCLNFREFVEQLVFCSLGGFYNPNSNMNFNLFCNNGIINLMKLYYRFYFNDNLKDYYMNKIFSLNTSTEEGKSNSKNYLKAIVYEFLNFHILNSNKNYNFENFNLFKELNYQVNGVIENFRNLFFNGPPKKNSSKKKKKEVGGKKGKKGRRKPSQKLSQNVFQITTKNKNLLQKIHDDDYSQKTILNKLTNNLKSSLQNDIIIRYLFEQQNLVDEIVSYFYLSDESIKKMESMLFGGNFNTPLDEKVKQFCVQFDLPKKEVGNIKYCIKMANVIKNKEFEVRIDQLSIKTKVLCFIFFDQKNTKREFKIMKLSPLKTLCNEFLNFNNKFMPLILANCCKSNPRITNSLLSHKIGYVNVGIGKDRYYCTKKEHFNKQIKVIDGLRIIDECRDILLSYMTDVFCNHNYREYAYKYYRFKLLGISFEVDLPNWFYSINTTPKKFYFSKFSSGCGGGGNDNGLMKSGYLKENFNPLPIFSSKNDVKSSFFKNLHPTMLSFFRNWTKPLFKNLINTERKCSLFNTIENVFWYEMPIKELSITTKAQKSTKKKEVGMESSNKNFSDTLPKKTGSSTSYVNVKRVLRTCHLCKALKDFNLRNYSVFCYMCKDCENAVYGQWSKQTTTTTTADNSSCLVLCTDWDVPFQLIKFNSKKKFKKYVNEFLRVMFY